MKKAASYARFSMSDQREESIDAQLFDNKNYAMKNGMLIVKEYVDRALTGRSDQREQFQNMISDAKDGLFDFIIVHKVDRFARDRYDSAVYKSALKKHGVRVVYSMQHIEDSPEGALMEGILESFAEYYSLNLSSEVMKGLKENAKKAQFNGGIPPLGYDIDENKHYIINEKESRIVRDIFDLYINGSGYKDIANKLNSKGYKNKLGKPFVFNSISSIIKNEKYAGIYVFNKTSRKYKDGKRNLKVHKPKDEHIRVENAIPSIIPMEVFKMAQDELKKRSHSKGKSKSKRDYILSSIIVCKKCGRKMSGYSQSRKKDGDKYYYYRCTGCNTSIRAELIEEKVIQEINNIIFKDLDKLLEDISKYIEKKENETPKEMEYLEKELKNTDTEINNIVNMITKGIGSLQLGKKLEELESYKLGIEERLKELEVKSSIPKQSLKEWLKGIKKDLDNKVNLKKIIPTFISKIEVDEEEYVIDFFLKAPQDGASSTGAEPSAPLLFAQTYNYKR